MTELELLFDKVLKINYPSTMEPLMGKINRIAFFPGGKGTFDKSETISNKKVMVVGQDFDCVGNLPRYYQQEDEDIYKNATWRNLLAFLKELGIPPDDCFFTNAIMGVREGNVSTGKSPAFKDKSFIESCREFFLFQIETQKPKTILVLGLYTARFLSGTSNELVSWSGLRNFMETDKMNEQVKKDILFKNKIRSNLVLLVHPSLRFANVARRTFEIYNGHKAEIEMVKSVLK